MIPEMLRGRGPSAPGPNGLDLLLGLRALQQDPLAFVTELQRRHGDVVKIRSREVLPLSCIGAGFATMQAKVALSSIARRFRLEVVGKTPVEPAAGATVRPRHPIQMLAHRI